MTNSTSPELSLSQVSRRFSRAKSLLTAPTPHLHPDAEILEEERLAVYDLLAHISVRGLQVWHRYRDEATNKGRSQQLSVSEFDTLVSVAEALNDQAGLTYDDALRADPRTGELPEQYPLSSY